MITKLPGWIGVGTFLLALNAGMINAGGFLGFQHQGLTHLTGSTTLLGVSLAQGEFSGAWHLGGIILAFVSGAILSGFIIQDATLRLGRRYGVALGVETLLLLAAVPLLVRQQDFGEYLASAACGLQNAMATTYSGAVVRTTHVSGAFTDLGIFLGQVLRGLPVNWRRFRLWSILIVAFCGGGVLGAWGFARFGYHALYLPAMLTGITCVAYAVYWRHRLAPAA